MNFSAMVIAFNKGKGIEQKIPPIEVRLMPGFRVVQLVTPDVTIEMSADDLIAAARAIDSFINP